MRARVGGVEASFPITANPLLPRIAGAPTGVAVSSNSERFQPVATRSSATICPPVVVQMMAFSSPFTGVSTRPPLEMDFRTSGSGASLPAVRSRREPRPPGSSLAFWSAAGDADGVRSGLTGMRMIWPLMGT